MSDSRSLFLKMERPACFFLFFRVQCVCCRLTIELSFKLNENCVLELNFRSNIPATRLLLNSWSALMMIIVVHIRYSNLNTDMSDSVTWKLS